MASLITDAEFAEIRSAINDVMDTFALVPATYRLRKANVPSRFKRDNKRADQTAGYDDVAINVLIVWDDGTERGQIAVMQSGAYDFSEGRVYMKYDDAIATSPPLVDGSKNLVMQAEKDLFKFNNVEYDIIGVQLLGQLKDTDVLCELHIKKQLKAKS